MTDITDRPNTTTAPARAYQLQFLRFLAFFMIFTWHAFLHELSWFPAVNGAANAVVFFFILSGFASGYSSYDKNVDFSVKASLEYLWKKLKKFYPLYIVMMLLSCLYQGIPEMIIYGDIGGLKYMAKLFMRFALMLQSWFPDVYFMFNGVGWFLSTIMFLYLFNVPLRALMCRIRDRKNSRLIYAAIAVVSLAIMIVYCWLMRGTNTEFTEYVFPPSRLGEYISGMALGYLIADMSRSVGVGKDMTEGEPVRKISIGFTIAEILAIVAWVAWLYVPVPDWQYRMVRWLIPNAIIIVIFAFGRGLLSQIFRNKGLVWLGDISFECFMIHAVVIGIFVKVRDLLSDRMMLPGFVFTTTGIFFICLAITLPVAALVHYLSSRRKNKSKMQAAD